MYLDGFLGVKGASTRSSHSEVVSVCNVTVEGPAAVGKPITEERSAAVEVPPAVEGPAIAARA